MVQNWTRLTRYWGKAGEAAEWHPLVFHQLDVAATGLALLDAIPQLHHRLVNLSGLDADSLRHWIGFFLAIHDLGKFSSAFQHLREDLFPVQDREYVYNFRHDTLGYLAWVELFADDERLTDRFGSWSDSGDPLELIDIWVRCVTGHHGQPPRMTPTPISDHFSSQDQDAMRSWVEISADLFLPKPLRAIEHSLDELEQRMFDFSWFLAGLCTLADWLGSNREHFPYFTDFLTAEQYLEQHARPKARQAVAASGFLPVATAEFLGPKSLFDFLEEPTPLQKASLDLPLGGEPRLYILEDVTGAGKTEAAIILLARMMAADQAQGAYIALPTMATANAMYSRTASVYRTLYRQGQATPSLVLAHGGRHLDRKFQSSLIHPSQLASEGHYEVGEFDAEARCNAWLADNNKKALLAHIGVGTIDQALLAILQTRHQSLRLLGLAGKVLIVDEVHASDDYMHTLLCELLKLHSRAGGIAILLSATLPAKMRDELMHAFGGLPDESPAESEDLDYPLLTTVSPANTPEYRPVATRESVRRCLEFTLFHDQEQTIDWVVAQANEGRCVAWIRNTVNDAIDAWQRVTTELGEGRVTLFHARFAMGDRLDIEKKVLSSFGPKSTADTRAGRVVIATQVIEQSLDLDFDEMVSDLAPVDLLIQRAGRLKRHLRDRSGNRLNDARSDQRGSACLRVLSPSPDDGADKRWIQSLLPGTGAVYRNHAQLWLTAKEISMRGWIRVPEDLRGFIESVYGQSAVEHIPEALAPSDARAEGKALSDRSMARLNAIKLPTGYACQDGQWEDESITPTRLGEPTITIRLGRWQDGRLSPWYGRALNAWSLSELKIAARLFREPCIDNQNIRQSLDDVRSGWPKAIQRLHVLPLTNYDGRWLAVARDSHKQIVHIEYSSVIGLQIAKE